MAPEELATVLRQQPFVPFRITLTEGSTLRSSAPGVVYGGPYGPRSSASLIPKTATDCLSDP